MVFSHRAYLDSSKKIAKLKHRDDVPAWNAEGTVVQEEMVLITSTRSELQNVMSHYVGIVRTNLRLKRALIRLDLLYRETEEMYQRTTVSLDLCELRNLINVAYLIVKSAMLRHESRGLNYNTDFPRRSKVIKDTVV